jgi:hypothetical protein
LDFTISLTFTQLGLLGCLTSVTLEAGQGIVKLDIFQRNFKCGGVWRFDSVFHNLPILASMVVLWGNQLVIEAIYLGNGWSDRDQTSWAYSSSSGLPNAGIPRVVSLTVSDLFPVKKIFDLDFLGTVCPTATKFEG